MTEAPPGWVAGLVHSTAETGRLTFLELETKWMRATAVQHARLAALGMVHDARMVAPSRRASVSSAPVAQRHEDRRAVAAYIAAMVFAA